MILWPLHAPAPRGYTRGARLTGVSYGPAFTLTRNRDGRALVAVEVKHLVLVPRHRAGVGTEERNREYTRAELKRAVDEAFDALDEE
jgi:hypothetical protein